VKFIAPLSPTSRKKYYQFTAIDDCTRIRVLRIYDRLNQKTAIQCELRMVGGPRLGAEPSDAPPQARRCVWIWKGVQARCHIDLWELPRPILQML
jgi:hypothetical protein